MGTEKRPRSRATPGGNRGQRRSASNRAASALDVPGVVPGYVCVGAITGAHGVSGAVRIRSFTAEPDGVASYGPVVDEAGARKFELEVIGASRGAVLVRIDGIETRDAAEDLKGVRLYISRAALPSVAEDEYYHVDLLGLAAETVDGATLGKVVAVHEIGETDVLEVERGEGRGSVLVPFTRALVREVDLAAGRLIVDPPPGLSDDTDVGADG